MSKLCTNLSIYSTQHCEIRKSTFHRLRDETIYDQNKYQIISKLSSIASEKDTTRITQKLHVYRCYSKSLELRPVLVCPIRQSNKCAALLVRTHTSDTGTVAHDMTLQPIFMLLWDVGVCGNKAGFCEHGCEVRASKQIESLQKSLKMSEKVF